MQKALQLPLHLRNSTVLSPHLAHIFCANFWRSWQPASLFSFQYSNYRKQVFFLNCTVLKLQSFSVGRSLIADEKNLLKIFIARARCILWGKLLLAALYMASYEWYMYKIMLVGCQDRPELTPKIRARRGARTVDFLKWNWSCKAFCSSKPWSKIVSCNIYQL